MTRKERPELYVPDVPDGLTVIWANFVELSSTRTQTMSGYAPISFSEINAYLALSGLRPSPWEVRVIRALDRIYLEETSRDEAEIGKCFEADVKEFPWPKTP